MATLAAPSYTSPDKGQRLLGKHYTSHAVLHSSGYILKLIKMINRNARQLGRQEVDPRYFNSC